MLNLDSHEVYDPKLNNNSSNCHATRRNFKPIRENSFLKLLFIKLMITSNDVAQVNFAEALFRYLF